MAMVTISLEVPDELARRLTPHQDRLPQIIALGLHQLEDETRNQTKADHITLKQRVLTALASTGIVTLPKSRVASSSRIRHTPIKAGGPPASEMIIRERRQEL